MDFREWSQWVDGEARAQYRQAARESHLRLVKPAPRRERFELRYELLGPPVPVRSFPAHDRAPEPMPEELVRPPTRAELRRALVVNALTKPVNVIVPAAVLVAALVIGAGWLIAVAVVIYVVLFVMTFFDADEAKRVGDKAYGRQRLAERAGRPQPESLAKPIGDQLAAALTEERRIRGAIDEAELPFADVSAEVDALVQAMERICRRADMVYRYLDDQNPAAVEQRLEQVRAEAGKQPDRAQQQLMDALTQQLDAQRALEDQLRRFYGQMEHTVTSLGAISARIVQASVAEEDAAQAEVAGQVRDLREQAVGLAEGMKEAYTRTDELDELDALPEGGKP